ncbi:class II D-tagatose-bisphosphate aldolase, non-catalytic subunit, partial [bacterium]|nr:class II D-tagatose-bisphosphate aldolase, non-catalytic subunit [bacterium]
EASRYGSFIKGHYSDSVDNPQDYPTSGMGGANIGPEFTESEYCALKDVSDKEAALEAAGKLPSASGVPQALENAVVASGRWEKWRLPDEMGKPFAQLTEARREWLVRTGCRYIWTDPGVLAARKALYANLAKAGIDADSYVLDKIVAVMDKYFDKFNLRGTISRIEKELEAGL